jgi:hypothetical protein
VLLEELGDVNAHESRAADEAGSDGHLHPSRRQVQLGGLHADPDSRFFTQKASSELLHGQSVMAFFGAEIRLGREIFKPLENAPIGP